ALSANAGADHPGTGRCLENCGPTAGRSRSYALTRGKKQGNFRGSKSPYRTKEGVGRFVVGVVGQRCSQLPGPKTSRAHAVKNCRRSLGTRPGTRTHALSQSLGCRRCCGSGYGAKAERGTPASTG